MPMACARVDWSAELTSPARDQPRLDHQELPGSPMSQSADLYERILNRQGVVQLRHQQQQSLDEWLGLLDGPIWVGKSNLDRPTSASYHIVL